jgi:hypothetical protein
MDSLKDKSPNNLPAQSSDVQMQVVVRDKHGNVKYQGPLNMNVVKEKEDGSNPSDCR